MQRPFSINRRHHRRLNIERLESRDLFTTWGNPWPEPERLTVSFAEDGTQIDGQASALFAQLDAQLTRETWQTQTLLALQTWANYANLNFHVTDDGPAPFGKTTSAQGLSGAGDIRIGAVPLSNNELAVAAPYNLYSDWSGEVVVNTQFTFGVGPGAAFDLFTVLLQETGHALSLAPSVAPESVLFGNYLGPRTDLSSLDIQEVQRLYGPRRADRFEGTGGNNQSSTATPLSFISDVDQYIGIDPRAGAAPFIAAADLTTRTDVDFYQFTLPAGLNDYRVVLRTSNISLLQAQITVRDSQGNIVGQAAASSPTIGDLELYVANAQEGEVYSVSVAGAAGNAFDVGGYELAIGLEAQEALFPSVSTFINDDRGDDDDGIDTLVVLNPKVSTIGVPWDYSQRASLSFSTDRDFYRITAPADANTMAALVVAVWPLNPQDFQPALSVSAMADFSSLLPATVLRNDSGAYSLEIKNITPGANYYIKIAAAQPNGSQLEGNYLLAADFRRTQTFFRSLAAGWLNETTLEQTYLLRNTESRLHHWRLTVNAPAGSTTPATVRLGIYNSTMQLVGTFTATTGEPATFSALLRPGVYTLKFMVDGVNPQLNQRLTFHLAALVLSDPLGPTRVDPGGTPVGGGYVPTYTVPTRPYYSFYFFGRNFTWVRPRVPVGSP
ncbi:MAG: matrixin family metalloprotease [Pirellulales bacterium]|nr:matrixin family metalloprotease [Pirellulales bacterium]